MSESSKEIERESVIYAVASRLGDVGKTKLQKLAYLLQEVYGVDLGCNFYLHQYGPYSEEVDKGIESLSVMGYLRVDPDPDGYGFHVTPQMPPDEEFESAAEGATASLKDVLDKVGSREAWELEAISTICYLHRQGLDESGVVEALVSIKPRFQRDYIETMYNKVRELKLLK
jgi:uncharacterized protein YwgA